MELLHQKHSFSKKFEEIHECVALVLLLLLNLEVSDWIITNFIACRSRWIITL